MVIVWSMLFHSSMLSLGLLLLLYHIFRSLINRGCFGNDEVQSQRQGGGKSTSKTDIRLVLMSNLLLLVSFACDLVFLMDVFWSSNCNGAVRYRMATYSLIKFGIHSFSLMRCWLSSKMIGDDITVAYYICMCLLSSDILCTGFIAIFAEFKTTYSNQICRIDRTTSLNIAMYWYALNEIIIVSVLLCLFLKPLWKLLKICPEDIRKSLKRVIIWSCLEAVSMLIVLVLVVSWQESQYWRYGLTSQRVLTSLCIVMQFGPIKYQLIPEKLCLRSICDIMHCCQLKKQIRMSTSIQMLAIANGNGNTIAPSNKNTHSNATSIEMAIPIPQTQIQITKD